MSDKHNKLNEDNDNIQFDKATNQDQKGDQNSSANIGTAPLKRLSPLDSRLSKLSNRRADDSENSNDDKPTTEKFVDQPDVIPPDVLQGITDDKLTSKLPRQPKTVESSDPEKNHSQPSIKAEKAEESETEKPADKPVTGKLVDNSETDKPQATTDKPVSKPVTDKLVDKSPEPVDTPAEPVTQAKFSELSEQDQLLESDEVSEDTSLVTDLPNESDSPEIETVASTIDAPKSSDTPEKSDEISFQSPDEDIKPVTYARRSTIGDTQGKTSFLSFSKKKTESPPEKNPDTAVLPEKSPAWKKVIDGQSQGTTGTIGEQREVLFVIRGMIERVVMKDNTTATLGRFDTGTIPNEEIDLIPYGAIDRGVSRRHCEILLRDDKLHVVDLGSTNGTFLAGIRLKPNEATLLRKGDELLLGRLAVQVLFR